MRKGEYRGRLLTGTEQMYVIDAARGLTARQSGERRNVSIHTVHSMLVRARRALGARNVAHAVALALIHGEITPADLKGTER